RPSAVDGQPPLILSERHQPPARPGRSEPSAADRCGNPVTRSGMQELSSTNCDNSYKYLTEREIETAFIKITWTAVAKNENRDPARLPPSSPVLTAPSNRGRYVFTSGRTSGVAHGC